MRVSRSQWEKLLLRWSGMEATGEVRLVCAVLADGIVEREEHPWFFSGGGFATYCKAIGLNETYIQEQIERADAAALKDA